MAHRAADTLSWWQGEGGSAYVRRNAVTDTDVARRAEALARAFGADLLVALRWATILEVGAGPGASLLALQRVLEAALYAVEPNATAREALRAILPPARVFEGHASAIPAADGTFNLVFTAGVLIHVHPDHLRDAMIEIARVSQRYVLAIEYFAPSVEPVMYYGEERIWRNDFGRLYAELGLPPVRWGFFWRGIEGTGDGFDSTVWWLLEKPAGWRADCAAQRAL